MVSLSNRYGYYSLYGVCDGATLFEFSLSILLLIEELSIFKFWLSIFPALLSINFPPKYLFPPSRRGEDSRVESSSY